MDSEETSALGPMLKDLEAEIMCGICFQQMHLPKALICMHTYCAGCVAMVCLKNGSITCPECRKETKVCKSV